MVQNLWPAYIAGALVAAAGLGFALIAMVILRRVRARRGARPAPPPRPAHEVAMEKLDRLGAYGFLENADNRPFYFAVSEVIREYLGARYGFDSLELTTDELMAELRRRAGRELVLSEAEGWLAGCDLVKFAKISPSATAEARRRARGRDPDCRHHAPRRGAAGRRRAGAGRRRMADTPSRETSSRCDPLRGHRDRLRADRGRLHLRGPARRRGFRFRAPVRAGPDPAGGGAGRVGGSGARARAPRALLDLLAPRRLSRPAARAGRPPPPRSADRCCGWPRSR